MNIAAMKTALASSKHSCICNAYARVSLFHSTPVLSRRRRNRHSDFSWWEQCGYDDDDPSSRRGPSWFRTQNSTNDFRRDEAANRGSRCWDKGGGDGFYRWSSEDDEDDPSSSRGPSWFRRVYSANNFRGDRAGNSRSRRRRRHWSRRGFQFCDDVEDIDMETIFRSAFSRGNGGYYWSFVNEENPQWWSSDGKSGSSRYWRHRFEKQYESDSESSDSDLELVVSERLALGLSASGPIKLEDVKTAYRSCALKWHPDRHQGSSKAVAEEKFKLCSAAYQSLCDKLTE